MKIIISCILLCIYVALAAPSHAQTITTSGVSAGRPYFSVFCSSCGSPTGSLAILAFDQVGFDSGSYWSASTHLYTPKIAGKYKFTCQVLIQGGVIAAGTNASRAILKLSGSTTVAESDNNVVTAGVTTTAYVSLASRIVTMNGSTDTMECDSSSTAATPAYIGGTEVTFLEGSYVGP